jgi:hypothetical protein
MDDFFALDPIEAYCVRCRTTVDMEAPQAVWTRKGQAATRGACPLCSGVVFRIGRTELHDGHDAPAAVQVGESSRTRVKLARDTVYVNFAPDDEEAARQIAADLERSGLAVWLHEADNRTEWASGVHPALKECARMVLIHSPAAHTDVSVRQACEFFRSHKKPIVLAEVAEAAVPVLLGRSPRFVMTEHYKVALRHLVDTLSQ